MSVKVLFTFERRLFLKGTVRHTSAAYGYKTIYCYDGSISVFCFDSSCPVRAHFPIEPIVAAAFALLACMYGRNHLFEIDPAFILCHHSQFIPRSGCGSNHRMNATTTQRGGTTPITDEHTEGY